MSDQSPAISNAALIEEIEAVNAIYGTDVVAPTFAKESAKSSQVDRVSLRPPDQPISFILSFQSRYPDTCPQLDGTQSIGTLGKGEGHHALELLQETLARVWTPGSVCLFDLIEEVVPLLSQQDQDGTIESSEQTTTAEEKSEAHVPLKDEGELTKPEGAVAAGLNPSQAIPNWTISEPITEKKSVFVARCASVADKAEATSLLMNLMATNKKVAAATHNITAWRIKNGETGATVQDCDDDGETAAGGRLLHLMQLMDVWNVVVVVSRWYGGVKLGPDRFRFINQVARAVLIQGGFSKMEEVKHGKTKGKR